MHSVLAITYANRKHENNEEQLFKFHVNKRHERQRTYNKYNCVNRIWNALEGWKFRETLVWYFGISRAINPLRNMSEIGYEMSSSVGNSVKQWFDTLEYRDGIYIYIYMYIYMYCECLYIVGKSRCRRKMKSEMTWQINKQKQNNKHTAT